MAVEAMERLPHIVARRRKLDPRAFVLRAAAEADCAQEAGPGVYTEGGRVRIVYLQLPERLDLLVDLLKQVEYRTTERTAGMSTTSRVFGYEPRKVLRKDYCSTTSLKTDAPAAFLALGEATRKVERYYAAYHPTLYAKHAELARNRVRSEWRLGALFTSGIVNFNNQLPYHYDAGNFRDVWSAMLVFKSAGITGGALNVPEFDLRFPLPDHSLFMFDGQGLIHGVTPFARAQESDYRISVVYYTLRQMWQCLAPGEELKRIRDVKTDRERRRGGLPSRREP